MNLTVTKQYTQIEELNKENEKIMILTKDNAILKNRLELQSEDINNMENREEQLKEGREDIEKREEQLNNERKKLENDVDIVLLIYY